MRSAALLLLLGLVTVLTRGSAGPTPRIRDNYIVEGEQLAQPQQDMLSTTVVVRGIGEQDADEQEDDDADDYSSEVELELLPAAVLNEHSSSTPSPPQPRPHCCRCRSCWRGCKKRNYNWGLCLFGRCYCFY